MNVEIILGGQLRTKLATQSLTIAIEATSATTLGDVLDELVRQQPDARDLLLTGEGTIAGGLLVLLDDSAVVADRELQLGDGATITLVPAISGG
ncbi:MAG: MoaD/ThiS family protein [Pirellulales bacterium]|nr:MoaD/ThiS family protein [Pirellulales bacterium]